MKLSEYAKQQGIHYRTALSWFHSGLIPNARQLPTGTIIVTEEIKEKQISNQKVVTYSRVSNASRRKEINLQVKRLADFCESKGFEVHKEYKEIASGMNDTRKQLWAMIDSCPDIIVVENKDRLTRFGFNYLEKLCNKLNIKIIVVNQSQSDEEDLIRDLVSIITSFCCRLYGLRRGYNKAKEIKKSITDV